MRKMVTTLLKYLRFDTTAYHARAVNLIWSLQVTTSRSHIESTIAQSMGSNDLRSMSEAYEAFGILWRLTGV